MADISLLGEFTLGESRLYNPRISRVPFLSIGTERLLVDYSIEIDTSGIEYLRFPTTVHDDNASSIRCEAVVTESLTGREYVVKSIDRQGEDISVECQLDLIDLSGKGLSDTLILNGEDYYQNNHYRIDTALKNIFRAAGWSFTWSGKVSETLFYTELSDEYTGTPYDILQALMSQMDVVFSFDQAAKRCTAFDPYAVTPDERLILNEKVNLTSVDCKTSSYDLVTRLFPLGNNLDIAPVNNGKYYVDNFSYTSRIIAAEWGCTDYNTPRGLRSAAIRYLRKNCVPQESYNLGLLDLNSIDDNRYPYLLFKVGSVAFYYDELTGSRKRMQVSKITRHPNRPEETAIDMVYLAEDPGTLHNWTDVGVIE